MPSPVWVNWSGHDLDLWPLISDLEFFHVNIYSKFCWNSSTKCTVFVLREIDVNGQTETDGETDDLKAQRCCYCWRTHKNRDGPRIIWRDIEPMDTAWKEVSLSMGPRRIFSTRGGQWGGLKDGSLPTGSRGRASVGIRGRSPQNLTTLTQNNALKLRLLRL